MEMLKRLFQEEEGQGLVEYAILIGIIVVGVVAVVVVIGNWVQGRFELLNDDLQAVTP